MAQSRISQPQHYGDLGWIILSGGLGEEAVYTVESLAVHLTSTHYG